MDQHRNLETLILYYLEPSVGSQSLADGIPLVLDPAVTGATRIPVYSAVRPAVSPTQHTLYYELVQRLTYNRRQ
jgi:hypothetical protein